jgi:hypothetical protein
MHESALSFAQRHLQDASPKGVVEFGSRNVNGSIREWVHHSFAYVRAWTSSQARTWTW